MKTNLYYKTVLRRRNVIKEAILKFFFGLCSYPRLLLEVFIRKNFGQRYFSLASAITVAVILIVYPILQHYGTRFFGNHSIYGNYRRVDFWTINNATWYVFISLFLVVSYRRWKEIKTNPSSFDFAKYSKYSGDINSRFRKFDLFGLVKNNVRLIEIYWEPALFLVIGIGLMLMDQRIGNLLFMSSICYSLGYAGAYKEGDDFVLDLIDATILNEELAEVIISDKPDDEARGVRFYAQKPTSSQLRSGLVDQIFVDEPVVFAI
jgi:hypothetical protein